MNILNNNHAVNGNGEEKPSKISRKRQVVKSFEAKMSQHRTFAERLADSLNYFVGDLRFAMLNFLWFFVWMVWNMGWIPGLTPFDPFPFGLLTMIVSLEAIFLAVIVLISQNREAKITELREEIELYINTHAENEITKILHFMTLLLEKNGIDVSGDKELQRMLKSLHEDEIEAELGKQL